MKNAKMLLIGLCIAVSSFLWSGSVYAEGNGYENWIDEQGAYMFPITPNSEEWNTLGTAEEMREATQIPKELLKTMSTKELIVMIENYPLLCDLYAYSSLQEGYERVKAQFNGIEELLSRQDSYSELIAAYRDFVIPELRKIDYDNILTADDYADRINILLQDEQSCEWILEDCRIHSSLTILEMLIWDVRQQNDENVDASVYSGQLAIYHASLVSVASQTFNCHSFAWLQSLYPNVYQYLWLNNTTAFIADPGYKKENSPSAAGHIATWSTHSAIVTVPSSNNPYNNYIPEPYLTSKWGNGPIVAHYQSLCPYYSNAGSIQYYYR